MYYLGLALYAEGPTDYYFLRPVLQRLCESICAADALIQVEFSDVLSLDHPHTVRDLPREQRIVRAAKEARGAWKIIFVHTDGGSNPEQARQSRTDPSVLALHEAFGEGGLGVGVLPVRETEAWAICDGDSLRQVLGTTLSDSELGLPRSMAAVEGAPDPKAILDTAFLATRPSGQRRRHGTSPLLNALGEQVALDRLRQLQSFSQLEFDVRCALRALNVL